MSTKDKEFFDNNKITEAICQFSFTAQIDSSRLNDFWSELSALNIYCDRLDLQTVHFNVQLDEGSAQKSELSAGLKLLNEKQDKIVQVFSDSLSIHQVGNYENWGVFRNDIETVLSVFSKHFTCEISRIDLRAINIFDFEETINVSDYFQIFLSTPFNQNSFSNYNFAIEQIYTEGRAFGAIRGNYIKEGINIKFILDLNFMSLFIEKPIEVSNKKDIFELLDDGNRKIYDLFISTITNKTKNKIK